MKVISLISENLKRLTAVEIRPDGNLVEITGANGQGKSSILDSLWWAIEGASNVQAEPIRKGADKAKIRVDLGELVVTRTFARKEDGGYTTAITVENAAGARLSSPQKVLDELIGKLAFDPLEFTRMKPAEQFDLLKAFVPGVNFKGYEEATNADYHKRTEARRIANEARAAAALINVPDNLPLAPIDEQELVEQLGKAAEVNAQIEARRVKRAGVAETAKALRAEGERLQTAAAHMHQEGLEKLQQAAAEAQRLAAAPPLPTPVDTQQLTQAIAAARTVNAALDKAMEKNNLFSRAERYDEQVQAYTEAMEEREADKQLAISQAKMPVEGIGFGTNEVLLGDVPFAQASDAEQLRASVAIAMALHPKLRVLRIRDGSLLDEKSLKLLGTLLDQHDFQCWIERVDTSGKVGFTISDGRVVAHDGVPVAAQSAAVPPKPAAATKPAAPAKPPAAAPPAPAAQPTLDLESDL